MKKKLFLFITCFFLLSSLAIFLTHRNIQLSDQNIQLSETIKKKEEEVKKNLKELEEQKGKSNSNYRDELPWQLNWKGAIISLVVCSFIAVPTAGTIKKKFPEIVPGNLTVGVEIFIIFAILLAILSFSIPPFFLAIAKYKDKNYKERYCLLWRDYWKPFACLVLSWLFFLILIGCYNDLFEKNKENKLPKQYLFSIR